MKSRKFMVVNSFVEKPFGGNPAAVFMDAGDLDKQVCQSIAKQMNLVETVFIFTAVEPNIDFYFRYFTPTEELPIAGHPTIAAVLTLIEGNQVNATQTNTLSIKTNAGNQVIKLKKGLNGPVVIMEQLRPEFFPVVNDRKHVAELFGLYEDDLSPDLPVQPVNTGLGHLIVPLKTLDALMRVQRKIEPLKSFCQSIGMREAQLFTFETYDSDKDLHTRNICPREGIEDPGCGVGNGALGAYLLEHYYKDRTAIHLKAEQGNVVDMPCVIEIFAHKEQGVITASIGGQGKLMIEGTFYLE